jgi:hypothetical protein
MSAEFAALLNEVQTFVRKSRNDGLNKIIGTIQFQEDKFMASDNSGRQLGSFPSVSDASDAVKQAKKR